MKSLLTIIGAKEGQHVEKCAWLNDRKKPCDCDGYHTFDELYEHRIALFCALGGEVRTNEFSNTIPWKSKLHSDGTAWDGWFIAGIGTKDGEQISYHIPMSYWDRFVIFHTRNKAPEWDGHTPDDVIKRLYEL